MNPEIKAAWVNALQSGEYEQGQGCLHLVTKVYDEDNVEPVGEQDRYCCLGVLCDLAEKAGVVTATTVRGPIGTRVSYGTPGDDPESSYYYLPAAVVAWAGLDGADPAPGQHSQSLASLNDQGDSFLSIARQIKENF